MARIPWNLAAICCHYQHWSPNTPISYRVWSRFPYCHCHATQTASSWVCSIADVAATSPSCVRCSVWPNRPAANVMQKNMDMFIFYWGSHCECQIYIFHLECAATFAIQQILFVFGLHVRLWFHVTETTAGIRLVRLTVRRWEILVFGSEHTGHIAIGADANHGWWLQKQKQSKLNYKAHSMTTTICYIHCWWCSCWWPAARHRECLSMPTWSLDLWMFERQYMDPIWRPAPADCQCRDWYSVVVVCLATIVCFVSRSVQWSDCCRYYRHAPSFGCYRSRCFRFRWFPRPFAKPAVRRNRTLDTLKR